jgi:hypothetical protein
MKIEAAVEVAVMTYNRDDEWTDCKIHNSVTLGINGTVTIKVGV